MNVEALVRKAVTQLKLKWGQPNTGFIAGGSIANLVWQYVSGTKAVVNDIDVFIYAHQDQGPIFQLEKKDVEYNQGYLHLMSQSIYVKAKYSINAVTKEGIFNTISVSKEADPQKILESFDINATAVGYSIDENKVYFLPQFEEFLKSGQLKIINLMTPAHTAIRLAKKAEDLSVEVDELEYKIAQLAIQFALPDLNRTMFQSKYAELYEKYQDKIGKYFKLERCLEIENWLLAGGKKAKLFRLEASNLYQELVKENNFLAQTKYSITSEDVLFYFRNIKNEKEAETWSKLLPFYRRPDYLDNATDLNIRFLEEFIKSHPSCIKNLQGYKLSEQLKIIENVVNTVGKEFDYETAINVITYKKVKPDEIPDDLETMALGLSVRKKKRSFNSDIELPF